MKSRQSALALSASLLFVASGVHAAIATPGAACQFFSNAPREEVAFVFDVDGLTLEDTEEDGLAMCPIHQEESIGAIAQFEVAVYDGSTQYDVECGASVIDEEGNVIATTPGASTSNAGTGKQVLTFEVDVGSTSAKSYMVYCALPRSQASSSRVMAIRTF